MTCECCRDKEGREYQTRVPQPMTNMDVLLALPPRLKMAVATLCHPCQSGGHGLDQCRVCQLAGESVFVWHCVRLAHMQDKHPSYVEKGANMPESKPPEPHLKKIGTLRY